MKVHFPCIYTSPSSYIAMFESLLFSCSLLAASLSALSFICPADWLHSSFPIRWSVSWANSRYSHVFKAAWRKRLTLLSGSSEGPFFTVQSVNSQITHFQNVSFLTTVFFLQHPSSSNYKLHRSKAPGSLACSLSAPLSHYPQPPPISLAIWHSPE